MIVQPEDNSEPGSIFAAILGKFGETREAIWNLLIGVEATFVAVLSVYIIRGLSIPEAGLVAMALASAAMIPRFNSILALNRQRIWSEPGSGRRTNTKSITSGLSIFIGMFFGFLVVGIFTDNLTMETHFQFILKETQVDADFVLSPERFSLGPSLFVHNLFVLAAFAVLAFLYRSLGTMIALGWNACAWAMTLVLFIGASSQHDTHPFAYALLVIVAIIPHLLTEAAAYVVGALAAIFLSRGVTVYQLSDRRLLRVLTAVVVLATTAVALLGVGAILEHYYAPAIIKLI